MLFYLRERENGKKGGKRGRGKERKGEREKGGRKRRTTAGRPPIGNGTLISAVHRTF